jgi:hypothetical protein
VGVEYNHLGKECESRKASQREEMCMGWGEQCFLVSQFLGLRARGEEEQQSLKLMQPWRVNYGASWRIIGANWSWKNKDRGCQA